MKLLKYRKVYLATPLQSSFCLTTTSPNAGIPTWHAVLFKAEETPHAFTDDFAFHMTFRATALIHVPDLIDVTRTWLSTLSHHVVESRIHGIKVGTLVDAYTPERWHSVREKNTSPRHLNVRMLVLGAATLNCMKAEHGTCLRFSSVKIRPMEINVKAFSGLLQVCKAFIWIVVELLVVGYMNSSGEHADWSSPTSMV